MNGRMIKESHSTNAKKLCVHLQEKSKRTDKQRKVSQSKIQKYKFLKESKIQNCICIIDKVVCIYIYVCDTYVITKLTLCYFYRSEKKKTVTVRRVLFYIL